MKKFLFIIKQFIRLLLIPAIGNRRLNIIKTIWHNFSCLPLRQALKLPIWIFANTKIYKLGKIEITAKIESGMIQIGRAYFIHQQQNTTRIFNKGKIIFHGNTLIYNGCIIYNMGQIIFGGYNFLTVNTRILVEKKLSIGKFTRVGFGSFFMDTNAHYLINIETGEVKNRESEIIIGNSCWISSGAIIQKGTILPDCTIVSSNSLVQKDYSKIIPPCSIIGGVPAKLLASGYRRIFNILEEKRLSEYFKNNEEEQQIKIDLSNIDLERYCTENPL